MMIHYGSIEKYHQPIYYFTVNTDYTIDFYRVYAHKKTGDLALRINAFNPDFKRMDYSVLGMRFSGYNYTHAPETMSYHKKQAMLQALCAQAATTENIRQNHGEIPLALNPEIAAREINDKVIVATDKEIEIWPLEYGDFESNLQSEPTPKKFKQTLQQEESYCAIS